MSIGLPKVYRPSSGRKKRAGVFKFPALFYFRGFRKPTALWGKQREWEPVSAEEAEGKKPMMFYRIAHETALTTAPFAKRYYFWEELLASVRAARGQSKDEL